MRCTGSRSLATHRSELTELTTQLSTDQLLLDAAAAVIDERGVDGATIGAITERAGQRNGAAVHYHFGGRDGLLDSLVARQHAALDAVRATMLNEFDAATEPDVTQLVRILVEPMVACLDHVHGRAFLRIQGDRTASGVIAPIASSVESVGDRLAAVVPEADDGVRLERSRLIGLLTNVRLARAAAEQGSDSSPTGQLATALVAAITAILTTTSTPT